MTVLVKNDFYYILHITKQDVPSVSPIQHFDFNSYWQYIPQLDKKLLHHTEFLVYPDKIFTTLTTDNIISVSDGGAKNETYGFFGLVIVSMTTKQRLIIYKGPVYGVTPNFYRAETYSIVTILRCFFIL